MVRFFIDGFGWLFILFVAGMILLHVFGVDVDIEFFKVGFYKRSK